MKKMVIIVILVLLAGAAIGIIYQSATRESPLPTYFNYSPEELNSLKIMSSRKTIAREELYYWQDKAYDLVRKNKTGSSNAARIYAYLLTAQRDAAYLSFNQKGRFVGGLDEISREVLCHFFADDCDDLLVFEASDAFSKKLTEIILTKVTERKAEDEKGEYAYERPEGDQYWIARGVPRGKSAGSWKTWLVESGKELRAPKPPVFGSAEDQKQLELVKDIYSVLTEDQKRAIAFWAGGTGSKKPAGLWLDFAKDYMKDQNVPLEKELYVRSVLAMGLADGYIIANDSKYTYWSQRPFMRDETIKTYMPTPNHPSYPSSAGVAAGVSVGFLSTYFPENEFEWQKLGTEAKDSRVWSGIHFPIDVEEGYRIGVKVTEAFLQEHHYFGVDLSMR